MVFSQSGFHQLWSFWPRVYIVVLGIVCLFFITFIYIWTFISLFFLDFYFPFFWTFISLFPSLFGLFYSIAVSFGNYGQLQKCLTEKWYRKTVLSLFRTQSKVAISFFTIALAYVFFCFIFWQEYKFYNVFCCIFFWIEPEIAEAIKFRRGHWCQIKPWF